MLPEVLLFCKHERGPALPGGTELLTVAYMKIYGQQSKNYTIKNITLHLSVWFRNEYELRKVQEITTHSTLIGSFCTCAECLIHLRL